MTSVQVKRLSKGFSKGMLLKRKSDSTTSTMDTSMSSLMSEPQPSSTTMGSSSNLMLSSSDRVANMSKREFEKSRRQERKAIQKAKAKSFRQKKALQGMPDIDEISENARKAENLRQRIRQKRRSSRGSLTLSGNSRGSLSVGGRSLRSSDSQQQHQETEPDIDHSRRSESHSEQPVPDDRPVGKEQEQQPTTTTPTTVCSILRNGIPTELEFSPVELPDLGPLEGDDEEDDGDDDQQQGESDGDHYYQPQQEEVCNHEDSLAFSNHTHSNLHESSQLFPQLQGMDISHTEHEQDNKQGTAVGDLLYPIQRRSSLTEEEEDLVLPLPPMDQVPSRQHQQQQEVEPSGAAGEGDKATTEEEVSAVEAKVATSPTLAPTQAPIVDNGELVLPQQSESSDATATAAAAPETTTICPDVDHPVQKQRRLSNLVQLRQEWIQEYNELQKQQQPQAPSMTQGEFILMKGEQRKQMLLQRQRELLLMQQQEQQAEEQKASVISSSPQLASEEHDSSPTEETVTSTPSPSPPPSTPSSSLDENISQLEQETWLFQEQIRKLELQLQETQQAEREELWMIQELSSNRARNEAIAEQVRDEYAYQSEQEQQRQQQQHNKGVDTDEDDEDDYFLQLQQQRKKQEVLVNELQIENKARRTESQQLNLQMVSLMQSNQRLEKATQETQAFNRELQLTLIQETVDHHKALLTELQMYQRQQISLERQIPKAVAYAQNERRVRRLYTKGNDTIVRHVLEEAFDRRLIEAITEMPPLVVTTKSRQPRGTNKSVGSLLGFGSDSSNCRPGGFCFLSN